MLDIVTQNSSLLSVTILEIDLKNHIYQIVKVLHFSEIDLIYLVDRIFMTNFANEIKFKLNVMTGSIKRFILFVTAAGLFCCCNKTIDTKIESNRNLSSHYNDSILVSTNKKIYMGEVNNGSVLHFSFVLRNVSSKRVVINKVDSNCGCISITSYPEIIFAGDTAELKGTMSIHNQNGHVNKPIFISFNNDGLLLLRVSCDVNNNTNI